MEPDKKNRLEWVQVLRGLAAVMVVFFHFGLWETKIFGSNIATPGFLLNGGEAGVDIFFVISGFIMVFITPNELRGRGSLEFLYRRFTRIFPPYWIVFGVMLIVWLQRPEFFNRSYQHQMDVTRSFFLLPQSFMPLLNVGWSLIHEVYFYLVLSGLLIFRRPGRIVLLALWFATVLLANIFSLPAASPGSPVLQLVLSPFSLEFQMGMVVAFTFKNFAGWRLPAWCYVSSAIGGILAIYIIGQFHLTGGAYPLNNQMLRTCSYGLAGWVVVLSCVQLDVSTLITAPKWGVFLGDASYSLYLVHAPIIMATCTIVSHVVPHPSLKVAIGCFCVSIVLVFGTAFLFHVLIERRLISFFHKLAIGFFRK
jgi:peptidoglycan/LPS O-acetylase OafA/YrhL